MSFFDRRRKRNIAVYASKDKLASRGRFYNEDDLAAYDVARLRHRGRRDTRPAVDRRAARRCGCAYARRAWARSRSAWPIRWSSGRSSATEFGRLFSLRVHESERGARQPAGDAAGGHGDDAGDHVWRAARAAGARARDVAGARAAGPALVAEDRRPMFPRPEPSYLYSNRATGIRSRRSLITRRRRFRSRVPAPTAAWRAASCRPTRRSWCRPRIRRSRASSISSPPSGRCATSRSSSPS